MNKPLAKKWAAVALACAASFSLTGCLILPGEFASDMTVRRSGDFSFSYKGEIQLVEAPAFKTDPDLSVMTMMGAGTMMGMGGLSGGKKPAEPVAVKGTFTLTTDARIIANNTEEGPESVGGMDVLRWDIGPASYGAPMALLKLVQ